MKTWIEQMFTVALSIHSWKLETAQMTLNWGLNKQTAIHQYNEILLSNKKGRTTDGWDMMYGFNCIMQYERNLTQKDICIAGCLAGSVGGAWDSWWQGYKFEPYIGYRDYIKIKL